MNLFGIKLISKNNKPINLERVLQLFAAFFWIFSAVGASSIGTVLTIVLLISPFRWLMILYLVFIYFDFNVCKKGGRKIDFIQNLKVWKYLRDYFPSSLIKSEDFNLDLSKNYLFCSFPHGVLSTASFISFCTNANNFKKIFPGFKTTFFTLKIHFLLPFYREYALSFGGSIASEESISNIIGNPEGGNVGVLMVGGSEESSYCIPGKYILVLKHRKGFVRVALQNGCPLVPVFNFGETSVYDQVIFKGFLKKMQNLFKRITGINPVFPKGRGFFQYNFGIIPRRAKLTTVVGKPIDVPKIEKPTKEDIEKYHNIFIKNLIELFDENKNKYLESYEDKELKII